jgi:predicted solute-binding protein
MNIENTFNLISRDILNRKHDKAKTRLLEIYDSLSQIGNNAMRTENKGHLENDIQKTFEKICEET